MESIVSSPEAFFWHAFGSANIFLLEAVPLQERDP